MVELPEGFRAYPFAEAGGVDEQDVVDFWVREGAMPEPVARERVGEVAVVVLDDAQRLVAVSTVYLRRHPRLGMDLWHLRGFVAGEHRRSALGYVLLYGVKDHLEERFLSGADTRAAGIIGEVENEILKKVKNEAVWPTSRFTFIGETERGDHLRVYYFPGARVPPLAG